MDSLSPAAMAAPAEDGLAQFVKRLALAFALLVGIGLPGGYFALQYSNQTERVELTAQLKAEGLTALVAANPELWVYQLQRVEERLLRYPPQLVDDRAVVRDAAGNLLVSVGVPPRAPFLVRSSPVYDTGRVVGYVEITHSYRDVMSGTLLAGLLGIVFGVMVYATLLVLPLRALRRVTAALARQRDLYNMLSQTNQAIVRITSREELFPTVCRVAVEHGRFRFAWVGLNGDDDRRVQPVASYGADADYLDQMRISTDESDAAGRGPTGRAFRTGERAVSNDFLNDPANALWHEAARRAGVRASAAFPLRQGGTVVGTMNLYAGEPGYFTDDVLATLSEMAIDVSYALDNFAQGMVHLQSVEALRAAEEQFRGLVEQSIAGIYIIQDGKFAYVNPRFAEIRGYGSADELVGRDPLPLVAEPDRGAVAENNRRLLAGEEKSISYIFTALRKDGSTIEVGVHDTCATYRGRQAIIGMMQDISEKKRAEEEVQRYVAQLKTAFMSTVRVATTLSEMRDPYTAGHERRVAEIAVAIGAELGLDARRQEGLRVTGYLHDIGKITIPSEILSKPGKLSPIEFKLIQGHSQASYDVLKEVEFPWPVADVALQHHERIDGSGYPQGLKGEAILLEARIMAVADVVEAMSSHRPYRAGLGIDKALAEIERGRGTAYDTEVAEACLRLFREKGCALPA